MMSKGLEQEKCPATYRFNRIHKRRATLGMKIQFARTVTPSRNIVVDHFELECPGYTLTNSGPELTDPIEQITLK